MLCRLLLGTHVCDVNCGLKAFTHNAATAIFHHVQEDRWVVWAEAIAIAQRLGLRVAEIGVRWSHDADSRVKPWRDGFATMAALMRVRRRLVGLPHHTHAATAPPSHAGGMTLIELLVVIAIIAIIMIISVPTFSGARQKAKETICLTNLHGLGRAMASYETANNVLPDTEWGAFEDPIYKTMQTWLQGTRWDAASTPHGGQLWPYYKERKILLCPMDKDGTGVFSYSMPSVLGSERTDTIVAPKGAPLLVGEASASLVSHPEGSFAYYDVMGTRHNGKSCMLYVDGHAIFYDWLNHFGDPSAVVHANDIEIKPYGYCVFPRIKP